MSNARGAKTWVEINAEALRNNVRNLQSLLSKDTAFCAVVKANAYGHDLDTTVRLATLEGVDHFGVDSIDEAMQVRKRAPRAEIFILGHTVPERLEDVIASNCIQTVYDQRVISQMLEIVLKKQKRARVNLKIETGTNRQGISVSQLPDFLRCFKQEKRFMELTGLSSHFADAENAEDLSFTEQQHWRFSEAVVMAQQYDLTPRYIHIACSSAAMLIPDTLHTMVRFGIALYGLWSSESLRRQVRLKQTLELNPVLSWKTRIVQIKDVPSGEYIGYARSLRTKRPRRIAVLPVGYYDGYRRSFGPQGEVLVHGQRCPILGNICMNMFMVDVSQVPKAEVGDSVTLLGRDGMHQITAENLAEIAGTINYEIPTTINPLLPRIIV